MEAKEDFYCMINGRVLIPGHWIVAMIGWIRCLNISSTETALEQIDRLLKQVVNPSHRAWLIFMKADILSDDRRYEEAITHYRHSLGIMKLKGMKVSMAEVKNSYGVNLFRMGLTEKAEKEWIECRNLCIRYNLPRMKSIVDMNLSDIWSKKGNFRRAHDNLRKAEKVLKEVGDYEGISGVNFNRALVYIREGKVQKAQECFQKAESYPLIYEKKRRERREVYNQCLEENGYPSVRNPI
jgi:tetratricopeptide (TPR) repeat protein